ncbi:hypothetical protein ECG_03977 [Echinococcus granulosus]|uniref:Major facilitator superfamily general substrate transporter n=1 Tax=Echinococcus granulosus TaxID=6210 RepID=A0A068WCH1_ECHGR|nr:hypothetical protein ECG_03977 [Echinococcus granulosus]CDS17747.1 Major facilitator superfamily general substrate transporter [Echinococcus granulosus]
MEQEADRNNQGFSFYNRKADFGCRVIKTVALFLCWCCLGLYAEVLGPSLQTYIDVTNSNTEQIGTCLSMRELGMFFGSLVGAFLADRFVRWRHFVVAGGLVLGAVTIGAVPWCTTVASLSATLFFSGCAHGTMTASGNPLLNSIWLEKSGGPFNFMHSGYGVGASVAPGLLASFTFAQEKVFANGTVVKNRIISLTTPYFIVGGLCCGCACLFCCFSFCQPSKEETTEATISKGEDSCSAEEFEDVKVGVKKFALLQALAAQERVLLYVTVPIFLLYAALVGNERVFSKYLFVFANEGPAHLPESDCFLLNSVYWIVFALARVVTVPVSLIVPLPILFAIQLVGAWAMALGFYLAPSNRTVYLAFTVCFGLFKSPLFPTGLGVVSMASPVSGVITFFVNLGSSVGASALQAVGGMVLNRQGRQAFPLLVMISALVLIFFGVGLIVTTYLYRKRHRPNSEPKPEVSSLSA